MLENIVTFSDVVTLQCSFVESAWVSFLNQPLTIEMHCMAAYLTDCTEIWTVTLWFWCSLCEWRSRKLVDYSFTHIQGLFCTLSNKFSQFQGHNRAVPAQWDSCSTLTNSEFDTMSYDSRDDVSR